MISEKDKTAATLKEYFKAKAESYKISQAFLFGSVAGGHLKEESDIDIAVLFLPEISSEEKMFDNLNDIAVDLNKLLGREVNVIPIYPDFRKPMLYYNAIISGLPLYARNKDDYVSLFNRALYEMEDFSIFGCGWQREAASRTLEEVAHG